MSRQGHKVLMAVDDDSVEGNIGGGDGSNPAAATVANSMWLGGAAQHLLPNTGYSQGFTGCIHQVQVLIHNQHNWRLN